MLNLNELCVRIARHSPTYCPEAGKKHTQEEWQELAKQMRKKYGTQLRLLGHAAAWAVECYNVASNERHARGIQALHGEMSRLRILRQDDKAIFYTLTAFAGRSSYLADLTRAEAGDPEQFSHNIHQLIILRGV